MDLEGLEKTDKGKKNTLLRHMIRKKVNVECSDLPREPVEVKKLKGYRGTEGKGWKCTWEQWDELILGKKQGKR